MSKTIGGKAKRLKRQARRVRQHARWVEAFTAAIGDDDGLGDDAVFPAWLSVRPMESDQK
jgi:hypothetical protein